MSTQYIMRILNVYYRDTAYLKTYKQTSIKHYIFYPESFPNSEKKQCNEE